MEALRGRFLRSARWIIDWRAREVGERERESSVCTCRVRARVCAGERRRSKENEYGEGERRAAQRTERKRKFSRGGCCRVTPLVRFFCLEIIIQCAKGVSGGKVV